jgi:hypothetical protein
MELSLFKQGQQVYQENSTLKQVVEFMEHPLSRGFYDRWIKSKDADIVLYFMWIYEQLEKSYPDLLPIERLALLQELTRRNEFSSQLLNIYQHKNTLTYK